ncbi:MAG TPA: CarD family transcriptional regulator [Rickettsia endosymbiont of Sericostoma sp.]|jgi:CarD family transcriptional regulator|uniref:CarD family transcriptional regulator n=1 Tax=unclassified Candidatus Tisiphia TaxID=2996318 RepID=UPI001E0903E6|nr:CarD family transcriptional regulator [Rickettsia endosymbiont of Sericostoma sp. HW-2014]HJD63534.1 CarD family transcriptional regulator [Rickettsia endosymbiont of Sericostoma sp.]
MSMSSEFKVGERIVYPSHGVGEIVNVEQQIIAGADIRVYVISFPQDKMILKVPVNRATISGLRKLVSKTDLTIIYSTLQGKAKQGNRMWSRRAQEYESKINSGNIVAVAEVVRDLYKNVDSDRSYSERTIYESALNRLAGELAILENINPDEAINKLVEVLKDKLAA